MKTYFVDMRGNVIGDADWDRELHPGDELILSGFRYEVGAVTRVDSEQRVELQPVETVTSAASKPGLEAPPEAPAIRRFDLSLAPIPVAFLRVTLKHVENRHSYIQPSMIQYAEETEEGGAILFMVPSEPGDGGMRIKETMEELAKQRPLLLLTRW